MYSVTITATATGESAAVTTYDEPTAALLLHRALSGGFTLTADPAAATVTLTRPDRAVSLTPAEPLAQLTPAQRRALLALAADPRMPLTWERSRRNVSHLEHAGHALTHQVSMSLLAAGYVDGTGHPGMPARLTLRAWLAVGRIRRDPATLAAVLRAVYTPAPATA
jgi:hypothetical protein